MTIQRWTFRTALAVCTMLLGSAFAQMTVPAARITAPINDSKRITISNSTTPLLSRSIDGGRLAPTQSLGRMILMLAPTPEQEKAAAALVAAQHDPKSKQYHKWLTPEQFGQQFGIADSDAAQVKSWLESNGLTVQEVAKSKRFITFSGNVASVERAFSTQMHTYSFKGKSFVANAQDIKIPAALQAVVKGVARLHSVPRNENLKIQGKATLNSITGQLSFSDGSHAMSPADFATIYNVKPLWNAGVDGSNCGGVPCKIAIVGRTDIDPNDISDFKRFFGLSTANPPQIIVNGDDPGTTGDVVEAILDVTWAGAVAPGAQIIYVESASNFDDGVDVSAAYIVDHNLAPVMSTSYGECEYNLGIGNYFFYSLWQQAAAQGITAFVSSGDNGAMGCSAPGSGYFGSFAFPGADVNGLASTPYNVAVGGTQFDDTADPSQYWNPLNSTGFLSVKGYIPEIVWNESSNDPNNVNLYASSGGPSSYWVADWQSAPGVSDWENFFAADTFFGFSYGGWYGDGFIPRLLPDVSLAAAGHDGYLICLQRSCASGYLYYVGGTSAASPSWAGIMALINQKTGTPQGNANPTLYQMFTNEGDTHTIFHDIVNGNNYVPGDANPASYTGASDGSSSAEAGDKAFGYEATAGYDVATGLGSVDVNALVTNWTGIGTAGSTTTIWGPAETAPYTHGQQLTFSVNVADTTNASGTVPTGQVAVFATQVSIIPNSVIRGAINASTTTVSLGNATVDGSGNATISTNTIQGGTWNIWARYPGDSNFGSSTSDNVQVTIGQEGSTTLMGAIAGGYIVTSSTPLELHYGEPIPLAAVVFGNSGAGYPSGSVSIQSNGTTLATRTLQYGENDLHCYASCASQSSTIFNFYSGLPVSDTPYMLTAVYGGDNSFSGSSSNPYPIQVLKGDTLTYFAVGGAVVPNVNAPLSGYVALNYSNAAALPLSGTITVQDLSTGTSVGTATVNADGTFAMNVQFAATGTHRLQASFSGDANTNSSVYLRSVAVVAQATTTTTLTSNPTAANYGSSVTLTAQVSSGVVGHLPTGTVTFADASGTLGTGTLDGTGKATLTRSDLAGGVHNVTASYGGDTVSATSTSSSVAVSVRDYKVVAPSSIAVKTGQTGTAAITVIPIAGFNSAISFSCTGLPTNASCSFSPSSVTPNGTDTITTNLTVSTIATTTATLSPLHNRWMAASGITFAGVLLVLPFGSRRRRRIVLPLMLLTLGLMLSAVGCGGGGGTPHNQVQPGTYTVTVGATTTGGTAVSHPSTISITVTN